MRHPGSSALLVLLLAVGPSWAQDAPAEAPSAEAPAAEAPAAEAPAEGEAPPEGAAPALPEGFVPPSLKKEVQAIYPPEAQEQKLAGDVVLLLTIDEEGFVSDVQIVQSAHPLLDDAAMTAGMQLEFTPATLNDEPTPVQLQYRYGFTYVEETVEVEAPVDEEKPVGILSGQLFQRGTRTPLVGIQVLLKELGLEEYTDKDGRFRFEDVPAGPVIIAIRDDIYTDVEDEEMVKNGEETQLTYRLEKETFGDTLQVFGKRPKKEVVRRTITVEEIRAIPGTNGDALQVVQNLPGVARTPFGNSDIILRGGGNTQAFLNQQPIPIPFHFGGIRSTVASALIESIDVYPGNFDVEYGLISGGVVDVRLREPRTDGVHGNFEFDVFDAGALVEGPVGDNAGIAIAIRRSYFDSLLAAAPKPPNFSITTLPRWYDGQILFDWKPTEKQRLRLLAYGSSDQFASVIEQPPEELTLIRGNAVAKLEWAGGQVEHTIELTDNITHKANIAYLLTSVEFGVGEIFSLDFLFNQLFIRDTLTVAMGEDLSLRVGMDVLQQWSDIDALGGGGPPREGESPTSFGADQLESIEVDVFEANCALFAAAEYKLGPVLIIPGVRFDVFSAIDDYRLQPRLTARWTVNKQTTVKAGVGQFVELPDAADTLPGIGNPELNGENSIHYSAGFEHQFTDAISLDVTGYYKDFSDLVTRASALGVADLEEGAAGGDISDDAAPPLLNQGVGRSYGMEVLLRHDPTERLFGWVSYTLQRSERRDRPDEPYRLFDFDQTHNLIIVGQYKLTPKWSLGFRWRSVTGNPDTPIVGSIYDADTGQYVSLNGETNSTRSPTFHQLDLRVDREWTYDTWRLIGYLDLRNTFNKANAAGFDYNYDRTLRTQQFEIPIVPSFGLRGEF